MKLQPVVCPSCKNQLGDVYVIDGKAYLFDGLWLIRNGQHNCPVCRRVLHWQGDHFDQQYQRNANEFVVE